MKYFDLNLEDRCRDGDNPNLEQDEKKLLELAIEYLRVFNDISSRLPKGFVKHYLSHELLHDYMLDEMKIIKRSTKYRTSFDVIIELSRKENYYCLRYVDVVRLETNINILGGYIAFGDYEFGEFLAVDEKYLSHEFSFFNSSTVFIQFRKLQFKKIK